MAIRAPDGANNFIISNLNYINVKYQIDGHRDTLISSHNIVTYHIVDAGEDNRGELGPVPPLSNEGEGECVHKQLRIQKN